MPKVGKLLVAAWLAFAVGLPSCDLGPGEPDPLLDAAGTGNLQEVRRRLDEGANPNKTVDGFSLLMGAASNGDAAIIKLLLERGADPNYRDDTNWTALMQLALHRDSAEVAEMLLRAGADPCPKQEGKEIPGRTALEIAEAAGHKNVAEALRTPTAKC